MSDFLIFLRWVARLSALAIVVGFLMLVAQAIFAPPSAFETWTGRSLLAVTCLGLLLAWRWELPGAALALAALIAYASLIKMGHHTVLYVVAAPGVLYLLDWLLRRYCRTGSAGLAGV